MVCDALLDEDVSSLSEKVRQRVVSVAELIEACLARIKARDPELHAFVAVFVDQAGQRALDLDAEIADGHWRGPLHGIPVAIKDIVDIEGEITGFGSRCYSSSPANRNAPLIASLVNAGAVIIGKTHTVEFAYGSWGTNYGLGTPVNPRVEGHASPGGSSSGSAVAVAGGLVPLAVGSDTGGSVRIPAALCGIAGMKPTHGLVPVDGVAPLSPSLDTIGPLARSVAGLRMLLDGMRPNWNASAIGAAPAKIWTVRDADLEPADPGILDAYRAEVAALHARGIVTQTFPFPRALAEYQRLCGEIMAFDAFRALAPVIADHRLPMDPWVRRRIAQGSAISTEDRQTAQTIRAHDIAIFEKQFGAEDILFLPATPFPPRQIADIDETEFPMSRFTRIANYLDLCAVTVPVARPGMPSFGLQLIARAGMDDLLLSSALSDNFFGHRT